MHQFKEVSVKQRDKMVIHTPDISKNFILNSAVRDATNILLRPYLASNLPLPHHPNVNFYKKDKELIGSKEGCTGKYQYFLTLMATIAWDFLNISNIFHCNVKQQQIKHNS